MTMTALYAETPSYQILSYPFSTRSAAMGGTLAAHDLGSLDIQGNPASYSFAPSLQAQAAVVRHLVGIKGYATAGVIPLEEHRLFGELVYFDYGLFDGSDVLGNTTGSFGFHEFALRGGYAYHLNERIRIGTRAGLFQRVAASRTHSRLLSDFGLLYHDSGDSLSVGVYLANLAFGEGGENAPTALRVGTSKILTYLPLRLNLDGEYGLNQDWLIAIGGEVLVHPQFRIRLGINTRRFDLQTGVNSDDFLAGGSAGFILEWQGLIIESAMQSFGAAGVVTQLSLGYSF